MKSSMKNIFYSIKKFFSYSYHFFHVIIILNILFIIILYGITVLSINLFPKKILISKKAIIQLNSVKQNESIWMIISSVNNNKNPLLIIVDGKNKNKVLQMIKSNKNIELKPKDYIYLGNISFFKEKKIVTNHYSAQLKLRYLKKNSIEIFELKPNASKNLYPYFIIVLLTILFLFLLTLLLPYSNLIKEYLGNPETKILQLLTYWKKTCFKSLALNLILIVIVIILNININYLKQFGSPGFAFLFVVNIWLLIFALFSYLWAIPVASYFPNNGVVKLLKKSVLITIDNIFATVIISLLIVLFTFIAGYIFSIFFSIYSLILLFVFPGVSGLFLFLHLNLSQILKKYEVI